MYDKLVQISTLLHPTDIEQRRNAHLDDLDEIDDEDADVGGAIFLREERTPPKSLLLMAATASPLALVEEEEERNWPSEVMVSCSAMSSTSVSASSPSPSLSADAAAEATEARVL